MSRYFDELKRRNVFRVGAAYAVVGWLIIEVVDTLAPRMAMPEWVPGFFIILVLIGFPVALLFSWAFEMTPEGLKKTAEVEVDESITTTTGQKINYVIIAALVAVILLQQFTPSLRDIASLGDDEGEPITIAVLPFADLSADGDQEYLGDGVAEEILNVLASTEGLKVTSRTSAFAFKGQNKSIPEIARLLGVSHVVEGSIRKQGDQVRITGQLIEVADDSHLWSDTYDAGLDNIFKLQDEIASNISGALSERLGLTLPSATREIRNWDIAAYELYLRARQLILAREDYETALTLLDTALQIEPGFADAWAEKASALALHAYGLGLIDDTVTESLAMWDEAWLAASRAIELQPDHSLALAVQGLVRFSQHRFIESRVLLERAIDQANSNDDAVLWYAVLLTSTGDLKGSLQVLEDGLLLSPAAPNLHRWRIYVLSYLGRWQQIWDEPELGPAAEMVGSAVTRQTAGFIIGTVSADDLQDWYLASGREHSEEESALYAQIVDTDDSGAHCDISNAMFEALWSSDSELLSSVVPSVCPRLLGRLLERASATLVETGNRNQLPDFWDPRVSEFRSSRQAHEIFSELELPAYWDLYGWPEVCHRTSIDNFVCE